MRLEQLTDFLVCICVDDTRRKLLEDLRPANDFASRAALFDVRPVQGLGSGDALLGDPLFRDGYTVPME